jgi:predicted peptidase
MSRSGKKIKLIQFIIFCILLPLNMEAQYFQKHLFVVGKDTLPYNILIPLLSDTTIFQSNETKPVKYPLIVFFHGSGERGKNNESQLTHIKALFLDKNNMDDYPAFIIAPQCPPDKRWVESSWEVAKHIMPEKESIPMSLTIQLINELVEKYPVDEKRIYVTGMSMGGFGTWDIICRYPGKFAAAIPICGGADTNKAKLLINTPIWAFHGSNDKLVKTILSRNMINAIKIAGGKPKYTEYPGVGHDCWKKAYQEKDLLKWLFNQTL